MPKAKKVTLKDLIAPLLDDNIPFPARFLHHFSDLNQENQALLRKTWPEISLQRRQALMEDLEQLGEADDLLSFEEVCQLAVQDTDGLVRAAAVRILSDYEKVEFLSLFQRLVEQDEHPQVRAAAAIALGPFVYMGEVDLLTASVLHRLEDLLMRLVEGQDQPMVRMRALESLGYSSRDEVIPLIEQAYNSGEQAWICAALFAMGRSADIRWDSHVLAMLNDSHPEVRAEAATAAGGLELKKATKPLIELLDDHDIQVRLASIWALSEIGGPGVRAALNEMLWNTDDDEEAQLLEEALDNLAFTDGSGGFEWLDLAGGEDTESDDEDWFDSDEQTSDIEG